MYFLVMPFKYINTTEIVCILVERSKPHTDELFNSI